jgi:thiosulfate reductase cytochrome b subunit
VSPGTARDWRRQLTLGEDRIDAATWAGSVPQSAGVAPRVRVGRGKWFNLLWLLPIGLVLLLVAVASAKGLRGDPVIQRFIARYPGTLYSARAKAATGFPAWLQWQHFLNLFFMLFIIRSGVQILSDHPRLYWTRHSTPGRDWFRIQKPVPADPLWTAKQDSISLPGQVGLPGLRHSIGLARWWHLSMDLLWLVNGIVFYVLLFATAQWQRLVPASWSVFPDALSVLIQYLSLNWPAENTWVAYNGLQLIAYFVTVFVAAPLALITGLGMSPALSARFKRLSKVLSIQVARSVHFLVLVYFLVFIVIHVSLVFATGLLVNLNHVYAGRTDHSWDGFWLFAVSMAVIIVAWVAATPFSTGMHGYGVEPGDLQQLHALGDGDRNGHRVPGDADHAGAARAGEVGLGVGHGLGWLQRERAILPVHGEVDGLRTGSGGFLCQVEGAFAGREGQPAVEDETGQQEERCHHDDGHRGYLPAVVARTALGEASPVHGPPPGVPGCPPFGVPRNRSIGATAVAVRVSAPGSGSRDRPARLTVHDTRTLTWPPARKSEVAELTASGLQVIWSLDSAAWAVAEAAGPAVAPSVAREAARAACMAAPLTSKRAFASRPTATMNISIMMSSGVIRTSSVAAEPWSRRVAGDGE